MKIAVLSNNTIRDIKWNGPEWHFSEYSQLESDIYNGESGLYQFAPDVILLSILPCKEDSLEQIPSLIAELEMKTQAHIFVHNLIEFWEMPVRFVDGGFERISANNQIAHLPFINERVQILDLEGLVIEYGRKAMFDPRYYFLAQQPFSGTGLHLVRKQFQNAIEVLFGKRKKCLVVDLDNTLWGGLLADEIQLSREGIGKAFYEFQKCIKRLADTGIILAICSKNDEEQALNVIRSHPDMYLDIEDFAAWRINWKDKPSNIIELAEELNIGLDSIVFIDDSDHEVHAVTTVAGVEGGVLPTDPAYYCQWITEQTWFETFELTDTDLERNEMYVQDRHRRESAKGMDYNEYLKSLNIRVKIERMNEHSKARIIQLSNRTNQFNINGDKFDDPKKAFTISYEDNFGDQGIVGAAVLDDDEVTIMGLYVSCRILGRGVEQAFLSKLYPRNMIVADTGKNKAAMEFLSNFQEGVPEWIEIEYSEL